MPALGASTSPGEVGTRPKNEEAYDLYLRSVSIPHDATPNKEAIAMLERSVGLDPSFAPAWQALGLRYYYDGAYADGGEPMIKRSDAAFERAVTLDPNSILAAASLITNRTERGELVNAYAQASALVKRLPGSGEAHFTVADVLRYAGLLDESARECESALALDPGNYEFRSCSQAFMQMGKMDRARDFVQLDAGSEWSGIVMIDILLRQGKISEAREDVKQVAKSTVFDADFVRACLQPEPSGNVASLARAAEQNLQPVADSEPKYWTGTIASFCGQQEVAFRLIKRAIEQNYCAYQALQSDPLLAKLRGTPEFNQLLAAAKQCQDRFLAQRN